MEKDSDYKYNPATGAGESQSSGLNINMQVGPGASVFAPILSHLHGARHITFSQNEAGPSHSGHETDITSVIAEYKKSLVAEHACIREYTSRPGEHVLLADRYVDPLIIQRHRKKKEKEKEIRSRGEDFHHARTHHTDHHITVDKLFSQEDSPNSVRPKAVILQGNSGSGKSLTAQKILYDWAIGNLFAGIFDIVFHLRCSELNDIVEDISLVELLNCSEEMAQILKKTPERVLFLVDGFDELRLSLPKKPLPVKADIKARPGAVLSSLLRGCMLNESFLLVTTRSIAAKKLGKLLKHTQRFTEIMGFSENGIQQYFQKFFENNEHCRQMYEEVKANGTLYSACSSPVMCWLVCSVFKEKSKMSKRMSKSGFRSTTSIFVDFVFILLEHHCQGLTESQQRGLLKDLGQLAHKGILKGRVLFQRNKVPETILNVLDSTRIPFLCTFHYKDRINVKEMFSFMHLSFQEFFAALLYTFLDETEAELKLEKLLSASLQGNYHLLPIVQFLFGLSNKAVSDLLMKKHQQTVSHATCAQMDKWLYEFVLQNTIRLNAHLCSFALHCLYEVDDKYMVQNAMEIWETNGVEIQLRSSNMTDYHAAAHCLQFCRRIRSLDLQTSTVENLKMLEKALSKCEKLHLSVSHAADNDVADLISAVGERKDLQRLSVEDGVLSNQSVKMIISTLHKHRSVGDVHLSVKTINYTNAETLMNILKSNVVSENLRLTMSTTCRNSEENLCSELQLLRYGWSLSISVKHERLDSNDVHVYSGESGQTFKSICCSHYCSDLSEMSAFDWRKFLQLSSNLKKGENPEFHENVDTLVSFLHSMPDLPYVNLDAKNLSQKCAAKILSFFYSRPTLEDFNLWFTVDSLKGVGEEDVCSLSLSTRTPHYMKRLLRLDLKPHVCSPHTTQSMESTAVLQEISLRFPVMKGDHVDWEVFLRRLSQMWKSLERYPLLSFLCSVPGLKEVMLCLSSLQENWAVRILSVLQACPSLQYLQVEVDNGSKNLGIARGNVLSEIYAVRKVLFFLGCSHLDWRTSATFNVQYTLPNHEVVPCIIFLMRNSTEIYNIDWRQFFRFYHKLEGLTEHCLEYDQSMDALLSVVNSLPGLSDLHLALRFLTVDGAFSIVQLMKTCPSLRKIDVTVPSQPTTNFTDSRESYSETNSVSTDHSDSSGLTDVSDGDADWDSASYPTYNRMPHKGTSHTLRAAEEIEHYELDLCSELKVRRNARNEFKLSLRCNSSKPDTKAVLAYISLILAEYTEKSKINWRSFLQSYYDTKGLTERSTDFPKKVNTLLCFLYCVPGLKEVELGIHHLTETWASYILYLCHDITSLGNICLLLENENDKDSTCSSFTVKRNHRDSKVTVKIRSVKYPETSPSFISFAVPHSAILNVSGPDLLYRMRCLRFLKENSYEYEEEVNKLMSFLHGIPGLQKLKLEIGDMTERWATRILSFSTCPSLNKIHVTTLHGHMLMEDAILKIKKKWKHRDCVVVLKGLRCSNSVARCTEENWTPHTYLQCNNMVKLSLCGGLCSQLDGCYKTDSESEVDTYDYGFDYYDVETDVQETE
ncbi:uncharacterized protein LOC118801314 [Colossoma macropomum]|uniref:uncharacterized protein LOC118801314 n=1 Tax=Colossoma macropomum TaxID=42526 RepID=UPI001865281E|nr:uncharacterized protein LOC118801314 [Colossoma macropomum]XP_036417463.1 uncharacterized protein LOC118801314 [Colossoma macropomum]XP_036417464.1 uncharacterized protein LOC118801314 [Colossoma macropomum]